MKTYKKKSWEKPNVSNLSIKSLTLSGTNTGAEKTQGAHASKTPS